MVVFYLLANVLEKSYSKYMCFTYLSSQMFPKKTIRNTWIKWLYFTYLRMFSKKAIQYIRVKWLCFTYKTHYSSILYTLFLLSMSVPSNLHKGRVTLSGVVVFENGRVLNKEKSARDHVFDGHVYLPTNNSNEALATFRYFNPGDPLLTPHAYFINAQVSWSITQLNIMLRVGITYI